MERKLETSPQRTTNGKSIAAEPALLHHASCMEELLQYGRDILISTAWNAMKSDDKKPYARDESDGTA